MYQAPALHQAVNRRNFQEVQRLIEGKDPDVKIQRCLGTTKLAVANEYWREETPLHIACRLGYAEIAVYLISSGSDVDGRTGTTPLHLAAQNGHLDVVNVLLSHGADISRRSVNGSTPLWRAANMGHTAIVQRLIEVGANVNANARTEERRLTPLQTAANEGHLWVVQLLISADCELDVRDSFGRTALHYAADMGFATIVGCLLSVGADANVLDQQGYSPLHAAASMRNIDVMEVMAAAPTSDLSAGAETFTGTALHLAVTFQFPDSVQTLISAGLDLDARDSSKYTPLFLATQTSPMDVDVYYQVIAELIKGGSNVNYRLPIVNTLLEVNVQKQKWPFVMILLEAACHMPRGLERYLSRCPPEIQELLEDRLCHPLPLKVLCRTIVREFIRCRKLWPLAATVDQLPLPGVIKHFLKMTGLCVPK